MSFSYDVSNNKKKYLINGKSTTKHTFRKYYPHVISFHPILMNLMYLQPSARRNFLDDALIQAFPEYEKLLSNYKKTLNSRNKLLKNIFEEKSTREELMFWNENFLNLASSIWSYRKKMIDFLSENI